MLRIVVVVLTCGAADDGDEGNQDFSVHFLLFFGV